MLTMILTRTPTQILLLKPLVFTAASDHNKRRNERTWARDTSADEVRLSLVRALVAQTSSLSQRVFTELVSEATNYVFPNRRFESRTLKEAFMSVPDLKTVEFKVLSRKDGYEIREVKPYVVAETTIPSNVICTPGASQSFNVLAGYLFGKNTRDVKMEMTTPVFTRRDEVEGEKMDITTPVITKKVGQEKWKMSFVMPSKYGEDLPLPKDSSMTIKKVPQRVMAVAVFPGLVTDEEVKSRESTLRDLINKDPVFRVKEGASLEAAQGCTNKSWKRSLFFELLMILLAFTSFSIAVQSPLYTSIYSP